MSNIKDLLRQLLKDNEEMYSIVGVVTEIDEAKRICVVRPSNGDAELFDVRLQSSVGLEIGLVLFPALQSEVTVTFFSKELAYIAQTSNVEKISLKINGFDLFIDKENFNTTVKNTKINSESYEVTAEKATFTTEQEFNVICQNLVNFTAKSFTATITEALTLTAPTIALTGAVSVSGAFSASGGAISLGGSENGGIPLSNSLVEIVNQVLNDIQDLKDKFNAWTVVPEDGGAALKAQLSEWTPTTENITAEDISNSNVTQ